MNKVKPSRDYIGYFYENPDWFNVSQEDIMCELQLSALGNFEKINWKVEHTQFLNEIRAFDDLWTPYLPRPDRPNNRTGILLSGLPGDTCQSPCSLPEARTANNNPDLQDVDFNVFTDAYDKLPSLQPLLDYFAPLGRTFILKMEAGSYFPIHKDDPLINRKTFRLAGFIGDVGEIHFMWMQEGQHIPIDTNTFAYIDTRKRHSTAMNNVGTGYHLIVDIPKTWENVIKIMSISAYM